VAQLVLGPLLRYVGETRATVWVETDAPCEVEVLGDRARTFAVEGHHYALVCIAGLEPASSTEYEVRLDGERRWPEPESPYPPSVIRTPATGEALELAFGSCRVAVPHEPPHVMTKDEDPEGRELDALVALGERMRGESDSRWPDALLFLGDQVYADEVSPATQERISARRGPESDPQEEVADFEEYTWLYRESWADPPIRWLLSTVPSVMIFDDHDVHDDWNTSWAWVQSMRRKPWWHERMVGAGISYWLYQHLGNLSPSELAEDELFDRVRNKDDATAILRDFAASADREGTDIQWSFHRDFGRTRLLMIDSRAGRVLNGDRRMMVDEDEWRWIEEHATGDFDHLVLATSLPFLLAPALHHLEAWNEAVCAGAWGGPAAQVAEKIRQAVDLEHWSAFHDSFKRLTNLIVSVASGERGRPPATIILLSGDVHHAYLAEAGFPPSTGVESAVLQAVCSPIRNPLGRAERRVMRAAISRPAAAVTRLLAKVAGVEEPAIRWRFTQDPTFDNQVGFLNLDGRSARVRIEKTVASDWPIRRLHRSLDREVVIDERETEVGRPDAGPLESEPALGPRL
jgi:PhoD-like phosphatase